MERVEAYYRVQEVEMGTVYTWCPEKSAVVECDCGEKLVLTTSSGKVCGECGANHEAIVEEVLDVRPEDRVEHPWRSEDPYYMPIRGT
jgi:hypothetical protein